MESRERIAVIGGGISGLSCAWALATSGKDVTLMEKWDKIGMDTHSVDIQLTSDLKIRMDVPLRVFSSTYYNQLSQLYKHLGIQFEKTNYSSTYRVLGDHRPFLHYFNVMIGEMSLPMARLGWTGLKLGWEYLHFIRTAKRDWKAGKLNKGTKLTIYEYLKEKKYSDGFIDLVLIPALAGMLTCTYESTKEYPADIIVEYLVMRAFYGTRRALKGTEEIVKQLSKSLPNVKLGVRISCVQKTGDKVQIAHEDGTTELFDHVVICTQANQALSLLGSNATPSQSAALSCFPYEKSLVVCHCDPRLMPVSQSDWSAINVAVSPKRGMAEDGCDFNMPEITVWMNQAQRSLGDLPKGVFQTWNPLVMPKSELIYSKSMFDRPILNFKAVEGISRLAEVQGENNMWFCGSYSLHGMPLLENGVRSGFAVARKLGATLPWDLQDQDQNYETKEVRQQEKKKSKIGTVIRGLVFLGVVGGAASYFVSRKF